MNNLKYYKQLIAAGYTDEQAQASVDALEGAMGDLITKDYLHNELTGIRTQLTHMKLLGWAMFVVIVSPSLQQFLELFK